MSMNEDLHDSARVPMNAINDLKQDKLKQNSSRVSLQKPMSFDLENNYGLDSQQSNPDYESEQN